MSIDPFPDDTSKFFLPVQIENLCACGNSVEKVRFFERQLSTIQEIEDAPAPEEDSAYGRRVSPTNAD